MTARPKRRTSKPDPEDGAPVWVIGRGEALTPGCVAWQRLGVGTRCETWLGWSTRLWAPVAVKMLRPHQVDHPRGRRSIIREADALTRAAHPSLPRLITDGRGDSIPHLVTDYLDGPALDEVLDQSGPLSVVESIILAAEVLGVVRALHRAGLAHIDLKPANVVLRDGRPYVIDLGSARPPGHRVAHDQPLGSPGYAAPELETGGTITAATDLYGVGTLLYQALTGRPPFNPADQASRRPPPAQLGLPRMTPPRLAALLRALLAPHPADRPDTTSALCELATTAVTRRPWPSWLDRHLTTDSTW